MEFQLSSLLFPGFLIAFVLYLRWSVKRATRLNTGVALVNRGSYAEALAHYEAADRPFLRTGIERVNRGLVLWRLWRLEEALAIFDAIVRKTRQVERPSLPLVRAERALVQALVGMTSEAAQALATLPPSPMLMLANAVVSAREGRFEDVRALLSSRDTYLLAGRSRALSEVLLAWGQLELEGAPRHRISLRHLWGDLGPEPLKAHWPELVTAVARIEAAAATRPDVDVALA